MYNSDTDLLFPARVIPELRDERDGAEWHELVERVSALDKMEDDRLAFLLMMIKINSCVTCHADSFRAMRGCTQCSQQNVKRYRGTEKALLKEFTKAQKEIGTKFKK